MTNQERINTVIEGFEMSYKYSNVNDGNTLVPQQLVLDALAILKAQPRVMTLDEVRLADGTDVWLELSGNYAADVLFATTIEGCGTKGLCTRYESLNYNTYGVKPYGWRCWTKRPTEKQREATPWKSEDK